MRICFDLSPAVHHHAGIGRYAQELLTALGTLDSASEYITFYNAPRGNEKPDSPLDRLPARVVRASAKTLRLRAMLAHFTGGAMDDLLPRVDLFHATDYWLPPLRRAASVLTIYDLTFQLFPEYHLPLNRWYLSLMLPRLAQSANALIAISEHTRRDVARLLQVPRDKIRTIPLGVSSVFKPIDNADVLTRVRDKYKLPPRFILYLGTLEPRKNLLTLLQAYRALLARDNRLPPLVLAGRKGWRYQSIFQNVRTLGLESCIRFTDWVDEQDTPALLSAADVFVYPSFYEGFGLPPLEAMACGTPVVCSNTSSLPEVMGDAGILFDPHDPVALANAIARVLIDNRLRGELRAKGLAQAAKFSWERTARETLTVYQHVGEIRNAHRP